jgi:hypothetical protein
MPPVTTKKAEHAYLSPSASHKWMACAGSLTLEEPFPNVSNVHADKGTACHTVAAACLTEHYRASKWTDEEILVSRPGEPERFVTFTDELVAITQIYVDAIRRHMIGAIETHIEQRLEFSAFVNLPDQFGTTDALIFVPLPDDQVEMQVHDAKFGHNPVEVEGNTQLRIYALGALHAFDLVHDIKQVRIFIHQPRLREEGVEEVIPVEELRAWGYGRLRSAAASVISAKQSHGTIPIKMWNETYLNPNPNSKECAYCRAIVTCPNVTARITDIVSGGASPDIKDFEVINPEPTVSAADLNYMLQQVPLIEDWCLAARAEMERRLLQAYNDPKVVEALGHKLVTGRQGPRKWVDKDAAEEILRKRFRIKIDDAYNLKIKSPTQVEEDILARGLISPRQWQTLQGQITRSEAKLSVAPLSDKRKPAEITPPSIADFPVTLDDLAG